MLGGRVSPSILQRLARHIPQNISTSALLRLTPVNRPKLLSTRLPRRTLTSSSGTIARAYQSPLRCNPTTLRLRRTIRYNSNKPTSGATQVNGDAPVQSLSQRFKELSRRYGYAAVGVYLGLSVLDFPFCFLAVRLIGPERVGELEHTVVDAFWSFISIVVPSMAPEDRSQEDPLAETEARETRSPVAHDKHHETASIWTQLLLAYGVHKSLIFFRVPLTAAVTPKVVKTLRGWGWNIGRPAQQVKRP